MRYMSTVCIIAVIAIVGIVAWSLHIQSPEPPRIPAVIVEVTPIDTTQEVQHIVIDNLATTVPEPTTTPYPIAPQPTTFVESLPICDQATPGTLCAPLRVLPVPTPTEYPTCTKQSYHDSFNALSPCYKPTETPTAIPTVEEPFR